MSHAAVPLNESTLTGAIGHDRNAAAHQAGPSHLGGLQGARIQNLSSGEVSGGDQGGAVAMACIAIVVVDVDPVVDHDGGAAPAPSSAVAGTTPVPGVVGLPGGKGNPAVISIPRTQADPHTAAAVKAEKGYQGRLPIVTGVKGPGVPSPTETSMAKPAPVVIGRPAPGVVTDPGPAVEVHPDPSTVPIGSPAHRD